MGLLNFRKKSKKSNAIKENSNGPSDIDSVNSPMVQSLLTDTSDISKNLLEEIFSDLPATSTKSFSGKILISFLYISFIIDISFIGSETSTKDIRHSLNLKSNPSSNINTLSPFSHAPPPTTVPPMIRGRLSTCISDTTSMDSFTSSEDDGPVSPADGTGWSESVLNPAELKQEDTTPLIELISRSYAASHSSIKKSSINTGTPSIQRSPGFAIDRMKERHRQEYHKSKQAPPPTPSVNHHAFIARNMASVLQQDSHRNPMSNHAQMTTAPKHGTHNHRSVPTNGRSYPIVINREIQNPKQDGPSQAMTNPKNNQVGYTDTVPRFSGKSLFTIKKRLPKPQAVIASNSNDYSEPNLSLFLLDNKKKEGTRRIVDETHQHFKNKFIYRYSYPCQQHRQKPEPRCSCQRRRRREKKPMTAWKPLLKITPFQNQTGFSITQDAQQPPKIERPRLKAQNQRHHPDSKPFVTGLKLN